MVSEDTKQKPATLDPSKTLNTRRVLKVCIVADKPDWAFANIAHALKDRLGPEIEIIIFYVANYSTPLEMLKDIFLRKMQYDLVHFLWRCILTEFFSPRSIGYLLAGLDEQECERVLSRISSTAITTSVYDHLFEDDDPFSLKVRKSICYADEYSVSSEILREIYQKLPELPEPAAVLSDGVDLSLFSASTRESLQPEGAPVRIGWAGNSLWGGSAHLKGLHDVIDPAVKRLQSQGIPAEGVYQDRQDAMVEHDDMPEYYRTLDIYVCASLNEGTPNPVLEAMASGVPVLSTDVGIVREAFGPKQQSFIVEDRNSEIFYQKLHHLATNPELRRELSQENLQRIQAWGWDSMAVKWRKFIKHGIQTARTKSITTRKSAILTDFHQAGVEILDKDAQMHHLEFYSKMVQDKFDHATAVLQTRSHRFVSWVTTPISRIINQRKK